METQENKIELMGEDGLYEIDGTVPYESDIIIRLLTRFRYVFAVALVILALISLFPLKDYFSSPSTYAPTIETLDKKKQNVTALVASSTALSSAISMLPDDTGSAVADNLMDISVDLGIVLIVIYLEKYLLTIFGFVAFGVLLPIAFTCFVGALLLLGRSTVSRILVHVAVRLVLLGAILLVTVPASVWVTDRIDETYEMSAVDNAAESNQEEGQGQQEDDDGGFLGFVTSIPQLLSDGVADITQSVLDQVGSLVEAFAVMIVTSCVVPILVLVFLLWIANLLLGIKVEIPVSEIQQHAHAVRRNARKTVGSVRDGLKTSK